MIDTRKARRLRVLSAALAFLVLPSAAALRAQSAARSAQRVGTILVAHGASEAWNRPVLELADSVRTDGSGPVEVAFLMGQAAPSHKLSDAMQKLAAEGVSEIVVVPILVSSSSEHYSQIRAMAGVSDSSAPDAAAQHSMAGMKSMSAAQHSMAGMHDMSMSKPAGVHVPVVVTPALDGAPAVAARDHGEARDSGAAAGFERIGGAGALREGSRRASRGVRRNAAAPASGAGALGGETRARCASRPLTMPIALSILRLQSATWLFAAYCRHAKQRAKTRPLAAPSPGIFFAR